LFNANSAFFSAMVAMLNIRLTLKSQNMMQSMKGAFLQILFLFGSVVSQKMSAQDGCHIESYRKIYQKSSYKLD
jgi:hypothetical protein